MGGKREDILITIHRTLDGQTLCVMEQTRRDSGLNVTPKQRIFVQYYIETGGNVPEAAMRAYNCSSCLCSPGNYATCLLGWVMS